MSNIDISRAHGMSEVNSLGLRSYIRGYTLIDVTNTGVLAAYNSSLPSFLDNADQVVNGKDSWERSRNQQRNWETLMQLFGMVAQPTILQKPKLVKNLDITSSTFGYDGTANVWSFIVGSEHSGIFENPEPGGRLVSICNKIPVITGLKETVPIEPSIFDTKDQVNLYFEKMEFH